MTQSVNLFLDNTLYSENGVEIVQRYSEDKARIV